MPRWGVPDVALVWIAGFVGAVVGSIISSSAAGVRAGETIPAAYLFWVVLPAQTLSMLGAAVLVSRRKGRGSLRRDFGFEVRSRDLAWVLVGLGLQFAFAVVLTPFSELLHTRRAAQEVVSSIQRTHTAGVRAGVVMGAVLLAPPVEELVYRGLLLRSLLRRTSSGWAIGASAAIFGLAHALDTGLTLRAVPTLLGLTGLGVVLAVLAVRDRSLSRAILVHMGFNTTLLLLVFSTT